MGDRDLLRGVQTGDGPGRVRSAFMGRVAPARDLEHAGDGLPDGGAPGRLETEAGSLKKSATLIPLTEPEVRRLLIQIVWPRLHLTERVLAWSRWRRTHQAHARACHYRTRALHNAQL